MVVVVVSKVVKVVSKLFHEPQEDECDEVTDLFWTLQLLLELRLLVLLIFLSSTIEGG